MRMLALQILFGRSPEPEPNQFGRPPSGCREAILLPVQMPVTIRRKPMAIKQRVLRKAGLTN